jgi:hypothetical protein
MRQKSPDGGNTENIAATGYILQLLVVLFSNCMQIP